jgi:hypothetical protein
MPSLATLDDLAVGGTALAVYLLTLAPTVTTGDSGELITAAATLSLAHPTGYPLYLLLGHAAIGLLPFVEPAVAMNGLSALAAAAACVVVRRVIERCVADRVLAASAALLLAFSPSFWSQATTARVYALGALLLALVLLELVSLRADRPGKLSRAWLWFGFGMANHTVMLVALPLLVLRSFALPSWALRTRAATWAMPGLALYAYIPIVASQEPVQSWGNPTSWERLATYLSRENFWAKRYVNEVGDLWDVAAHYAGQIPVELSLPGALLLAVGVAAPVAGRRWVATLGLYLFVANAALMALHGSRQDIFYWSRYMISGWLGLTLVVALGMERVCALLPRRAGVVAVFVPAALALFLGYGAADRSSDTWARDFAAGILESALPGALIFTAEDNVEFPLSYLVHVEGMRPDVEVLLPDINRLAEKPIEPDTTPTYFTYPIDLGSNELEMIPDGLVFRLMPRGSDFRGRPWQQASLPSFEELKDPESSRYLDRSLIGNYYFLKAMNLEQVDPAAAFTAMQRLREISFDNAVNQVNAGLLLERNQHLEDAHDAFETAAKIDPSNELAVRRAELWRETLGRSDAHSDSPAR